MFLTGKPLRSVYRVLARDGRVVWFQCEARMVRRDDGAPWFIQGVGFDVTRSEDGGGGAAGGAQRPHRHPRHRRRAGRGAGAGRRASRGSIAPASCERLLVREVAGPLLLGLFPTPEESERCQAHRSPSSRRRAGPSEYEDDWVRARRLPPANRLVEHDAARVDGATPSHIIATGIDVTERQRLQKALLEISAREQRRIGQDLHDGLGQHLTGIAFMSKVLGQQLAEERAPDRRRRPRRSCALVNKAIDKTRELRAGCVPVFSDAEGLMSALRQMAGRGGGPVPRHLPVRLRRAGARAGRGHAATHLYHIAHEAVNNAHQARRRQRDPAHAGPGERHRDADRRGRRRGHLHGGVGPTRTWACTS